MLHSLPYTGQLPDRFTYPFHYRPHPVAVAAARDLQRHLREQTDWEYGFGLEDDPGLHSKGKMFGVLVVKREDGALGYLAAFSGKLAGRNDLPGFVPPVFDLLRREGYFRAEEARIGEVTSEIRELENGTALEEARRELESAVARRKGEWAGARKEVREKKEARKNIRRGMTDLPAARQQEIEAGLAAESIADHFGLKDLKRALDHSVELAEQKLLAITDSIKQLKEHRAAMSHALQRWIHAQYRFLSAEGAARDLNDIFAGTAFGVPPAGAGECAAPKLLQYAYAHGLRPVALAEFWWGAPPPSAIRRHGNYYPACRGKCLPILGHMLEGLDVDPNPLEATPEEDFELEIVYEDAYLVVVNKPSGLLSVPGRHLKDCVLSRLGDPGDYYAVHRLDMHTSGLLLLARTPEIQARLQRQFAERKVKKRYLAQLDGVPERTKGRIELPLAPDVLDRPRQVVSKQGRPAMTDFETVEVVGGRALVHFYPVTGRTHQLRVHAAHPRGLNCPIVGDDLYGTPAERLMLHAEELSFVHPESKELVRVEAGASDWPSGN